MTHPHRAPELRAPKCLRCSHYLFEARLGFTTPRTPWRYFTFSEALFSYFVKERVSRHAVLARDSGRRTFRHREELLLGHTAPVLCQQTLRINLHTGRIRGKGVSLHVGVGLFNRTAVYLKLHSIAVRILVVKRKCNAMMNAPIWCDTHLFETLVSSKQVTQVGVGVRYVIYSRVVPRLARNAVRH